jgi:uncharacterized membrane protein
MTPSIPTPNSNTREKVVRAVPGALMLVVNLALIALGISAFIYGIRSVVNTRGDFHIFIAFAPMLITSGIIMLIGHFTFSRTKGGY